MVLPFVRRSFDLDSVIPIEDVCPSDPPGVRRYLAFALRKALDEGFRALTWFYHEEDDVVRCCIWHPDPQPDGTWYEHLPVQTDAGRQVMRELRARVSCRRTKHSEVSGTWRYTWQGRPGAFNFESPHDWEVRFFLDAQRPKQLPYTLYPAGFKPGRDEPQTAPTAHSDDQPHE